MEFKIEELGEIIKADIVKKISSNEAIVAIADKECKLKVIAYDGEKAEFMLDNKYYTIKYVDNTATSMKVQVIGGNPVTINKFPHLQHVVRRVVGGAVDTQKILQSPIPGRVVAIEAKPDMQVKKGDVIAVLESMKMQVAIKAHKDGVVKEIRIKEGSNVARNDSVAIIE
jgi:biotin carboxyl carrier protein